MSMEIQLLTKLELALVLQLISLTFMILSDPYILKERRRLMLLISAATFSLLLQNRIQFQLEQSGTNELLRTLVSVYGYSIRPLIIVLFLKTLDPEKDRRFLWWLTAGNAAIYMSSFFSGAAFAISDENLFIRGPLGYSCHVVSAWFLLQLLAESFARYRQVRAKDLLIPLLCAIQIIAATIFDSIHDTNGYISFLTVAVVISCLFYYLWLHLQFVREHEQALEAEQRIQIMISQIQPHFLYNTLSTIQALCRIDPEKAFETTEKFGTYLRMNIDSLNQARLIPFQQELEHTKIYADIEMMRFPYIHINYEIAEDDFSIPALSVQPIVENAIRHGVRGLYNGIVTVSTTADEQSFIISVTDNGRGFEPDSVQTIEGTHIGLKNVRERVEALCGGTLLIESSSGKGATVTIRIPR